VVEDGNPVFEVDEDDNPIVDVDKEVVYWE
jgi:hypothetical protein